MNGTQALELMDECIAKNMSFEEYLPILSGRIAQEEIYEKEQNMKLLEPQLEAQFPKALQDFRQFYFANHDNTGKYIGKKTELGEVIEIKPRRINQKIRLFVFQKDNYTCRACGFSNINNINKRLVIDHIVPVNKGGTDDVTNLQTLCAVCNGSKSDK